MSDYTPTTEWLRIMIGYAKTMATDRTLPVEQAREQGYEWFDRWLAAHDEEVLEKAVERVDEAYMQEYGGLFDEVPPLIVAAIRGEQFGNPEQLPSLAEILYNSRNDPDEWGDPE